MKPVLGFFFPVSSCFVSVSVVMGLGSYELKSRMAIHQMNLFAVTFVSYVP